MIETLDRYVLKTLDNLEKWKMPRLGIRKGYNLFMGSGNAHQVGKIYANHFGGVAADTTYYKHFVKFSDKFDERIIISASGGKDALKMAKTFKNDCVLLTCSNNPPAGPLVKKVYTFPSLEEPPSYNISTYASMIHALDPEENMSKIRKYIEGLKVPDLRRYSFIPVVSMGKNEPVAQMCATKIRETLGIGSIGKCVDEAMHGWFLHERKGELVMCLNLEKFELADNVIHIDYSSNLGLMLAAYFLVGKNQTDELSAEILERYKKVSVTSGWKFGNIV